MGAPKVTGVVRGKNISCQCHSQIWPSFAYIHCWVSFPISSSVYNQPFPALSVLLCLLMTVTIQPWTERWLRPSSVLSSDTANESTATEPPGECPIVLFHTSTIITSQQVCLREPKQILVHRDCHSGSEFESQWGDLMFRSTELLTCGLASVCH